MDKRIKHYFYALCAAFVLVLAVFFLPGLMELVHGPVFLLPMLLFSVLGVILTITVFRGKAEGKPKVFLLMAGISSGAFFPCIFLHNAVYALLMVLFGQDFWSRTGIGDEPVFFLLGLVVCPAVFLAGITGVLAVVVVSLRKSAGLT